MQFTDTAQRFRSLFENSLDLILFQDRSGAILDANKAFLTLVQQDKAAVMGHSIDDFLPGYLMPVFREKLHQAFEGIPVSFEASVQFTGAEPKVWNISKVPLLVDGGVANVHMIARDITAQTEAYKLIERQARKLNTIFESITDAMFAVDRQWRMVVLNRQVERLLKLDRQLAIGRNLWDLFPEEAEGEFFQHYRQVLDTGRATQFEAFYQRGNMWLEVKAFPSEEGLSVYFSDITARREAEASQKKMTQDLYRQNQDLQQFTYLVSHNLRAPLANARGLASLLQAQEPGQEDVVEHLQTSLQQLDAVLQDLNSILAVRDKQNVEPAEVVVLADVLGQVLQSLHEPLQQCGGQVTLALPPGLEVHGTRAYLFSIFWNLLSNSIKYRHPARTLHVHIEGGTSPEYGAVLTVRDNGSGFDRVKASDDVFKLYKRFHAAPTGRGVGLYLVHAHIAAMGGTIEVQSQPELGTEFFLRLP